MADKIEVPSITFSSYDVSDHNEQDVYGTDHRFVFTEGEAIDYSDYKMGWVLFNVGGGIRNDEYRGIVTDYSANTVLPIREAAELRGRLITEVAPERDGLEVVARSLVYLLKSQIIEIATADETTIISDALN